MPKSTKGVAARPKSSAVSLPKAHVASTAVVVSDRNRSTQWYTERLGLDIIESMDHWVTVGRKGKGGMIHICQTSDFEENPTLEPGNSGIQIRIPGTDFAAACRALEENGVEFSHPATKEDWGWYATVRDPDGNEITLGPE